MRYAALLAAAIAFLAVPSIAATCTGADPCKACKVCSSCKHCAKGGGTCGVCKKPEPKKDPKKASLPSSTKKA